MAPVCVTANRVSLTTCAPADRSSDGMVIGEELLADLPAIKYESEIRLLRKKVDGLEKHLNTHRQTETELKRRADIQSTLNEVLHISLLPLSLDEQLERILDLILDISWLALEKKGLILLAERNPRQLRMAAYRNLDKSVLNMCESEAFGHYLCGRAATSRDIIFADCMDDRHDNRHAGMRSHGHYVAPLVSKDGAAGVLILYVKEGHQIDSIEQMFLSAAAHALTGIIERKQMEQRFEQMSYEDALTGLPNRRRLVEHLHQALPLAVRMEKQVAVMFLDLDRFKSVNDSLGHEAGDLLLKQVAERLSSCLRDMDILARLGGDEFVILLELLNNPEEADEIARRIVHALTQPFQVQDHEINIGISIGISLFPIDGHSPDVLVKHADTAMYHAKEKRDGFRFFSQKALCRSIGELEYE